MYLQHKFRLFHIKKIINQKCMLYNHNDIIDILATNKQKNDYDYVSMNYKDELKMDIEIAKQKTAIILSCSASILTMSLFFWYQQNPQQFIEHRLGITSKAFDNIYLWIVALAIAIGYIVYTLHIIPFVHKHLLTFSPLKLIGIWTALTLSPMEEIVFRQILMDYLSELNFTPLSQIIISAFVFGIAHSLWFFLNRDIKMTLLVILTTTILGATLATLYIIGERNILAPIVTHIIINLAIEPWLIFAAIAQTWSDT